MAWYNPFSWFESKTLVDGSDNNVQNETVTRYLRGESFTFLLVEPRQAYTYYSSVSSLNDAVDKIATKSADLPVEILLPDESVVTSHPVIDLLNSPEGFTSRQARREVVKSYELASEAWVVLRGAVTRPPLSWTYIPPYEVDVQYSQGDGIPISITTQCNRDRRTYRRTVINGRIHYIDALQLNEIVPIIGDVAYNSGWRGLSKLSPLVSELNQIRGGKRHNESLLANGAKPSMVVTPAGSGGATDARKSWTQNIVNAMTAAFRERFQGAGNAGNVMILGEAADIQTPTISNADMDYINLLRDNTYAVYNAYNIPLALISPETMTLDNYKQAQLSLYTEAVFPAFTAVFETLFDALRPRYNGQLDGVSIKYDELAVRALRDVHIQQMKGLKETEAVSINEIRTEGGFRSVPEGDDILVAINKTPLTGISLSAEGMPEGDDVE